MAHFDRPLRAKIQAPEAEFAFMAPVGAGNLFSLHRQGLRRAASRARPAADAAVRGDQGFSHEETADEDIKNREEGNEVEDGQRPDGFVEVVRREPQCAAPEKPVEVALRFSAGPGDDAVGVAGC